MRGETMTITASEAQPGDILLDSCGDSLAAGY